MSIPLPLKKKKTDPKSYLRGARLLVLIGLVVLGGLGAAITRDFFRKAKINKEISGLDQEISGLEKSNEELSGLIAYFNSDTFREREARAKLNVQKPGERVIEVKRAIPKSSKADSLVAAPPKPPRSWPRNNPARWWYYFFAAPE